MAKNYRRAWCAAKIEATAGSAETLAAADAAILAFDPQITPDIQISERAPAGLSSGTLPGQPGLYAARIRIRVELKGSGTIDELPVWAQTLLLASAMDSTVTADTSVVCGLVSAITDQSTATVAVWMDGRRHTAIGCMFNARITGRPGEPLFIEFDGRGIHVTPTDEAAPTGITHESTRPLRLAAATLTLGGVSKTKLNNFNFDFGNDIQLRTDIANASGLAHAYMADRRPTFEIDPEGVSISDDDIWGDFLAGTSKAIAFAIGSVEGNRIAIAAPAYSHENPTPENGQGILRDRIPGRLNSNGGNDDQFTMTYT